MNATAPTTNPSPAAAAAAAGVHLLPGGANLMFRPVFAASARLTVGYLTTAMHGILLVLEPGAALWRTPALRGGAGGGFRGPTLLTIRQQLGRARPK